ncbi:MAG TPA: hypothetical protein VMB80_01250 [Candidatus Acidoferrum sp.]|nr:hypothetical protein [Candidatus Acidoferrum sp.]
MEIVRKTESRWSVAGEVILWVIFYFWAVWIFNAFLPPKPDQTPFEAYVGKQLWQPADGSAAAQARTPEAQEQSAQMMSEGMRR